MKIDQVKIDGFGKYRDFKLDSTYFSAPVTLFYGPNEAGKSTLHTFIRSIMFGFPTREKNTYAPVHGGHMGGHVLFRTSNGEKVKVQRSTPPKKGKVQIWTSSGEKGEKEWQQMLGHVSPSLYQNIFAFSHTELQQLSTLQSEDISAFLYSATMGLRGVDLLQTEKKLQQVQEDLFKPRAVKPHMNRKLKQLEEKEKDIMEVRNRFQQYAPLQQAYEQRLEEQEQWRVKKRELEERKKRLQQLVDEVQMKQQQGEEHERLWTEREHVQHQLQQLQDQLGPFWTREEILETDVSIQKKDFLLQQIEQLQQGRVDLQQAEEKRQQLQYEMQQMQDQYERIKQEQQSIEPEIDKRGAVAAGADVDNARGRKEEERGAEVATNRRRAEGRKTNGNAHVSSKERLKIGISVLVTVLLPLALFVSDQHVLAGILFLGLAYMTYAQYGRYQEQQAHYQHYQHYQHQLQEERERWFQQWEEQIRELQFARQQKEKEMKTLQNKIHALQQDHTRAQQEWKAQAEMLKLNGEPTPSALSTFLHTLEKAKEAYRQEAYLNKKIAECEQALNEPLHVELLEEAVQDEATQDETAQEEAVQEEAVQDNDQKWYWPLIEEKAVQQIKHVEQEEQDIQLQIEERATEIGQKKAEMEDMAKDESLVQLEQQWTEEQEQFRNLTKQWSVHRIAQSICQHIRHVYEEERQPSVLQQAGQLLQQMTEGKYQQVIAPLGAKTFEVLAEDGRRWGVEQLSQGTVEQLYLAMRLAFIQEYGKHVILPVMMDDVFVHFDDQRLYQALRAVHTVSKQQQILLFTCHEHICRQAQQAIDDVRIVSL